MPERYLLRHLSVDSYIHPEERYLREGLMGAPAVKKLISDATSLSVRIMSTVTDGSYVQVYERNAPALFHILRDVCRILDYGGELPDLYIGHRQALFIRPYGVKKVCLLVSDYVLETYDEEMLYYLMGNAVSMIMAGQVEISTLMTLMPGAWYTLPIRAAVLGYLHAADVTSDRGGLLACQSLAAAVRSQLLDMGMPPTESRLMFRNDQEAEAYVEQYLLDATSMRDDYSNLLVSAARQIKRMTYVEAENIAMMRSLLTWYRGGYRQILQQFGKEMA